MVQKWLKKITCLGLCVAMLTTSVIAFNGGLSPMSSSALPPTTDRLTIRPVTHNNAGALTIIESLMSADTKNLYAAHNQAHPDIPFIKDIRISEAPSANVSSIGLFSGGLSKKNDQLESILNFNDGVIFSTGHVSPAANNTNDIPYSGSANKDPNQLSTSHMNGLKNPDQNLADLIRVPLNTIQDTSSLEFKVFIPKGSKDVMFEYAIGSEEYNEYLNFNDVFGLFINGKNIATVPNKNDAISISNINYLKNSIFYRNNVKDSTKKGENYGSDQNFLNLPTIFDGVTTTFTASGTLIENQYNTIKIAIADNRDQKLDSVLFLKSGTMQFRKPQYGTINLLDWSEDNVVTIDRSLGSDNAVSVDLEVLDLKGRAIELYDEELKKNVTSFKARFDNGQIQKTVILPPLSKDALKDGTVPKVVRISNPQFGAVLGTKTRIEKDTTYPTIKLGLWDETTIGTADTLTVERTGLRQFNAQITLKKTSLTGTLSEETIAFDAGEGVKKLSLPDDTQSVELVTPLGATLGTPNRMEKVFRSVLDIADWSNNNVITLARTEYTNMPISVKLEALDQKNRPMMMKDEATGALQPYFIATFASGQSKKNITLPSLSSQALIQGTVPKLVRISAPTGGAVLGTNTSIEKPITLPIINLGTWNETTVSADDLLTIVRTGLNAYDAQITLKKTDLEGVVTTEIITIEANKNNKIVTIPDKTRFVEIHTPLGATLGTSNRFEKVFENVPTTKQKLTFTVVEDSEVTLELVSPVVSSPKFNYKITKRATSTEPAFSFYGDGKNLPNGMRDLYYMKQGVYEVEIYWLDPSQAETPAQIAAGTSKTLFTFKIEALTNKIDKKKFYKKIN